jgi:hypothetical protein
VSVDSALAGGRAAAAALMVDQCTIGRPIGKATDPTTSQVVTTYSPVYSGPCKVQILDVIPATPEAGGRLATVTRLRVDVPIEATAGVTVNDVVTITAATFDTDLVGRTFRVIAPFHGSMKTARRLPVEEIVG